jgi:hypothetical protein
VLYLGLLIATTGIKKRTFECAYHDWRRLPTYLPSFHDLFDVGEDTMIAISFAPTPALQARFDRSGSGTSSIPACATLGIRR